MLKFSQLFCIKGRNNTSSRSSGIKLGSNARILRSTTTSTISPEEDHLHPPTSSSSDGNKKITQKLNIGIVVPFKAFGVREYTKAITTTKSLIARKLKLFKTHDIQVHIVMKQMTPSPTGEC